MKFFLEKHAHSTFNAVSAVITIFIIVPILAVIMYIIYIFVKIKQKDQPLFHLSVTRFQLLFLFFLPIFLPI